MLTCLFSEEDPEVLGGHLPKWQSRTGSFSILKQVSGLHSGHPPETGTSSLQVTSSRRRPPVLQVSPSPPPTCPTLRALPPQTVLCLPTQGSCWCFWWLGVWWQPWWCWVLCYGVSAGVAVRTQVRAPAQVSLRELKAPRYMVLPPPCGRCRNCSTLPRGLGVGIGVERRDDLLPVPRQLWSLLIYCLFFIYSIGPQETLSTAMSSTGPGRFHTGFRPSLRRSTHTVNREPRLYIPPPSPNLLHDSNFRFPNPAPGPGLAIPSQSIVCLLQIVGSRDRPLAERNP